ncbi:MAG: sugar transferase [Candidatus Hydrogenedentes bacterium]|nr:sugar transferase [Candidatus Hydrogenedentota bacterium]
MFKPSRTAGALDTAWTVVGAIFVSAGLFGALAFAMKLDFMSRGFIVVFVLISAFALALEKCALMRGLSAARRRDRNLISVLIVGTGQRAHDYIRDMQEHPEWGMRALGVVDIDRKRIGSVISGVRVIGDLDCIPVLLVNNVIDVVAFVVPRTWLGEIGESVRHCELQGIDVQIALDLFPHKTGRVRVTSQGRTPVLSLEATAVHPWQAVVKRALDIVLSAVALVVLAPVMIVIAVLIKLASPGPVFFRQVRNGLRGREFKMLKFRSMVHDADAQLEALREQNQMSGAAFKMANDPRVTPLGKYLRKFSLDELPQFINVLRGDMSLVGPRPLIAAEKDKYEEWQRRRMSVRPGLTCLWQINGRSTVDFEHWMKLDLQYIDNWSILTDLKILAKTVPALLHGRGAY